MTARQINLLLQSGAACLGGAAILLAAGIMFLPLGVSSSPNRVVRPTNASSTSDAPTTLPPVESFRAIWANSLRRPLVDVEEAPTVSPQNTAAPAPAPSVALPPLALVGTVGTSLAMLRGADGSIQVKGVGDTISGAEVVAIRENQVDLRLNGSVTTLEKPRAEDGAQLISPAAPERAR